MKPGLKMDNFVLETTGKKLKAHHCIIGIDAFGEVGSINGGYDQGLGWKDQYTNEERRELAEHMIERWKEWGGITK